MKGCLQLDDNTITSTGTSMSSFMGVLNESVGKGTTSFVKATVQGEPPA